MTQVLCLTFEVGENRYAIDANEIIEVVPLVNFTTFPKAPSYFAGRFNYRGEIVPVLDLKDLMMSFQTKMYLSTRIIVVKYETDGEIHQLGLLGEKVMDIIRIRDDELQDPGLITEETRYLGRLINLKSGVVQLITVKELIPPFVRESLFRDVKED
ncbi:MAG: chemotaxis protein CheW [Ignavibacteriaceae bacterium]|nr:MAG: chemotaxis protein CheW [Ignavibacteriaceae bacterium]